MGVRVAARRRLLHTVLVLWAFVCGGCVASQRTVSSDSGRPEPAWLHESLAREYVLEIGDVFDLKLFYHPELNDVGVVVRSDGKISAQLIGDVVARGRTPSELAADLAERYARAGVRQPNVAVLLRKSAGLRVFVGGEVNNPGMIPHDGQLTISRAILQAGGPKPTAEVRTVVVLRDSGKGQDADPLFAVVDLDKLLTGGRDALLQPYDVIFVPKSRIAKLNQFIEQYFVKMSPIPLSAGFFLPIGPQR